MAGGATQNNNQGGIWQLFFPTAAEVLAFLAGAISLFATVVVYRPGGVAGGNVCTSWASAYAALSAGTGYRVLFVDATLGTAAIDASGADLSGVWVIGLRSGTQLRVNDGVTLTELPAVLWDVWLLGQRTSGTHYTTPATGRQIQLRGNSILSQAVNGGTLITLGAGHAFNVLLDGICGIAKSGTGVAVSGPAGASLNTYLEGNASVLADCLSGAMAWNPRMRGSWTGAVLTQTGLSGAVSWDNSGTKYDRFGGSLPCDAAATVVRYCINGMGTATTAMATLGAAAMYPFSEQRRFQRVTVFVYLCTATTDTLFEVYVNGVATGIAVTVPALTPQGTVVAGTRVNAASAVGSFGSSGQYQLVATNTAGGAGNVCQVTALVEWI